jgi:soluble lytic murein transglycosylase-like protein
MLRRALLGTALVAVALTACGHKKDLVPEESGDPTTARLEQYARIIQDQGVRYHVPPALIGAVVFVESGGNPHAVGPSGTVGLMQLKPATAAHYGIANLDDPAANITAGTRYLHDLLARFNQNMVLAIAAYRVGPAAIPPSGALPAVAQRYVDRVLRAYDAILQALRN